MPNVRDNGAARGRKTSDKVVFVAGAYPALCEGLSALINKSGEGWRATVINKPSGPDRSGQDVTLLVAGPPDYATLALWSGGTPGRERRPVLVVTTTSDPLFAGEMLARGATGCTSLATTTEELLRGLREVQAGRTHLGGGYTPDEVDRRMRAQRADADAFESLTPREREVLQLVAEGLTNDGVALRLDVSRRTVEAHRAHVMNKLRLRNATDLLRYALRRGLVGLD